MDFVGWSPLVGLASTLVGYHLFFDLLLLGTVVCTEGLGALGPSPSVGVPGHWLGATRVVVSYGDCSTRIAMVEVVAGWVPVAACAALDR